MGIFLRGSSLGLLLVGGCTGSSGDLGGSGVVEGTVLDLRSAVTARVIETEADEGDAVQKGQRLVRLDCRRLEAEDRELAARIAAAEADIAASKARSSAALGRTSAGRQRVRASDAELKAARAEAEVAARDASRVGEMGRFAPASERDRTETRAAQLSSQLEAAQRQAKATREDVRVSEAEAKALSAQVEAAERLRESLTAQRERLKVDLEECVVSAPRDAFVEEVFYDEGETPPAGSILVRLVDLDEVWVTFYLPNAQLGALTLGDEARVHADAWPDEVFSGTITTVASEAEFTPRNIQTREDRTRLVYPVEVRLENPGHRLRPGMPVEVSIPAGTSQ